MSSSDLSKNPLIHPPKLPHDVPALDIIKPEHFMPAIEHALAVARAEVEAVKNNPAVPTFENTIEALEFSGALLTRVSSIFGILTGAHTNDALDALEAQIDVLLTRFGDDVSMDPVLFARVKAVHDKLDTLSLTDEQDMLLDKTYKGFVRRGALLNDADKQKMRANNEQMAFVSSAFGQNNLKSTKAFKKVISDVEELRGLPQWLVDGYADAAKKAGLDGQYLIQLSPPPIALMEYSENRALREEIYRARVNTSYKDEFDNSQNVREIVRLRHEMAQLLGFGSYAAYALDERMAKTPETVNDFLRQNRDAYRPAAEEYLKNLRAYAKKKDGLDDVQPWDVGYYGRLLKEETFQLKLEDLRPYFNLDKVLEGLRDHSQKLFGIQMTEVKGKYPVYQDDVRTYEVTDSATGQMLGIFYGDYYARIGEKSNGAWMTSFRKRGHEEGESKIPLILNVCNFDKPVEGAPTQLSLDDVRTLFHEFGHALHGLLAEGTYGSLTGTAVKRDFVELPSQLQENWVREKEVLDVFALHQDTGAPLPAEMIEKMIAMENFDAGYMGLRQTFFGALDMAYYGDPAAHTRAIEEIEDAVLAENSLFPRVAGLQSVSFSHIMNGGYAAGYYGYKWAEVLDADVFARFQKEGLYNSDLGKNLREHIYSKGGTREPMDLFVALMGREPDLNAMFAREGIAVKQAAGGARPKGNPAP